MKLINLLVTLFSEKLPPHKIVLNTLKGFTKGWTADHARAAAQTPEADIKGINTYAAGRYDAWIRDEETPPPASPRAKLLSPFSIDGERFWIYWKKR